MKVWTSILALSIAGAFFVGCADATFQTRKKDVNGPSVSTNPPTKNPPGDPANPEPCREGNEDNYICFILKDSFERSTIQQPAGEIGFGWSSLIDDVAGANGDRVEANIYNDQELGVTPEAITGPETDQGRSLLFTGRPGGSVHSVFLVSEKKNLSNFNSVVIQFEYLPIGLGQWSWDGNGGNENIRLEVCESNLENCGVSPQLDENGLNSSNWSIRYQSPANIGHGLNGHNHVLADWNKADVRIDISKFPEEIKKNFVFRIAMTLDQGFLNGTVDGPLVDGLAVDNVSAIASKGILGEDDLFQNPAEPLGEHNID